LAEIGYPEKTTNGCKSLANCITYYRAYLTTGECWTHIL